MKLMIFHLKLNIDRSSVQVCFINVKKISGYKLNVLFTDPHVIFKAVDTLLKIKVMRTKAAPKMIKKES